MAIYGLMYFYGKIFLSNSHAVHYAASMGLEKQNRKNKLK